MRTVMRGGQATASPKTAKTLRRNRKVMSGHGSSGKWRDVRHESEMHITDIRTKPNL